jgi:hypothetical protein
MVERSPLTEEIGQQSDKNSELSQSICSSSFKNEVTKQGTTSLKDPSTKSSGKMHRKFQRVNLRKGTEKSQSKKVGRKPENLELIQRKDVIIKTLLRKMRTSLWKDFKSFTLFKSKKSKILDPLFYDKCLRKYAVEKLNLPARNSLLFYLSCIISPKNSEELLSAENSCAYEEKHSKKSKKSKKLSEIKEVYNVLYQYSHAKFKRLLKNKNF